MVDGCSLALLVEQQLFNLLVQGRDLPVLRGDLSFEHRDSLVLLLDGRQQLLLVVLEEVDLFEQVGEHAFVLVVLDDALVVFYFVLVVLEALFYFVHVVLVGVDELCLLSSEHGGDLVFEMVGEGVDAPDEFFDFFGSVLDDTTVTLYLWVCTSGRLMVIYCLSMSAFIIYNALRDKSINSYHNMARIGVLSCICANDYRWGSCIHYHGLLCWLLNP